MKKNLLFFLAIFLLCSWSMAVAANTSNDVSKSDDEILKAELARKQQILLEEQKQEAMEEETARLEAEARVLKLTQEEEAARLDAEAEALKMAREEAEMLAEQEQEIAYEQTTSDKARIDELLAREQSPEGLTEAEEKELKELFSVYYPQPVGEPGGGTILVTGDDCSDPISVDLDALGGYYFDADQTTCGRVNDYSSTCLGNYDGGEDILYEFIIGTAGNYIITMDPHGTTWTGIVIDDTCPPGGTGECIAYQTGSSGIRNLSVTLDPGTYYVMVDTYPSPTCIPVFDLTFTLDVGRCCYNYYVDCTDGMSQSDCLAQPGFPEWTPGSNCTDDPCPALTQGDYCTDPIVIPESFPYTDAGNTCGFNNFCDITSTDNSDVIYRLDITTSANLSVSLCNSAFDTKLAVFQTDCCTGPGTEWLYNDDNSLHCPTSSRSYVEGTFAPGTYYIVVDGFSSYCGDYELVVDYLPTGRCCYGEPVECADVDLLECTALGGSWAEGLNCTDDPCPDPTGNDCTTPIVVDLDAVGLPYTDTDQTTCGRLDDYNATCLGSYDGGEDVVYEIIVGTPDYYLITLDPQGTIRTGILIDDTCPPGGSGACIAYKSNTTSDPRVIPTYLEAGTYYIMVDTYPDPTCIPAFNLTIDTYELPPNDECVNATPVEVPSSTAGSTVLATPDDAPTCGTGNGTGGGVWYSVIGTGNTMYASTCDENTDFDTKVRVYCHTCDELMCAGGDDDDPDCSFSTLQSTAIWCSIPGQEYYILVHGFSANVGNFVLHVSDDGVPCADPPICEPPIGRCCYGDPIECADNTETECGALGGLWAEGFNCTDTPCPAPEGDDCSDPVVVDLDAVGLPYTDAGQTTCGRVDDYNATCLGIYDAGEDIIYQVIVSTADEYVFTLDPLGTTYTGILLDDACPPGGTGECIAYVGSSSSSPKSVQAFLDPGTYYVMVDKYSTPNCITAFNLTIDFPPVGRCCYNDYVDCTDNIRESECLTYPGNPEWTANINCTDYPCASVPTNDICEDRIQLEIPSDTYGSTIFAEPDDAPTCGTSNGTGGGVWYSVIGTGNTITATLCDELTDYDTKMRVYCFDCGDLYCAAGDDDSPCDYGSLISTVEWCSEVGTEYFILVHGFSSNVGYFMLHLSDNGVPCEDPPVCAPPVGACCVGFDCVGNTYQSVCDAQGGYWYEGEDCDAGFECPVPRQVGLATTANIPDVGVSNFGPLGEYDTQGTTYDWNAQGQANFAGTFVMGNSPTTMFSYYNAGITDCWEYTATDFLNMDDTFHPTSQYDDSGVLGGLTINYCGHGFNVDNPPEEAGDIFVHVFTVTNTGTETVSDYYAGVYYDWDIGGTDLITFDRDDNLIIQGPNETYNYGICLLNAADVGLTSLAGVAQQDYIYPSSHPPGGWQMSDLYTVMSTGGDNIWDNPAADMSSLVSSGPHTIDPGESVTFKFAIIGGATTADIIADAQLAATLEIDDCSAGPPCGPYVIGDWNGSLQFNVADIIAAFGKLKGQPNEPALLCECPPGSGNSWAVAMDVNGNCAFNLADIIWGFGKLKGQPNVLTACPECPPGSPSPRGGDEPLVVPNLKSKAKISTGQGMD